MFLLISKIKLTVTYSNGEILTLKYGMDEHPLVFKRVGCCQSFQEKLG